VLNNPTNAYATQTSTVSFPTGTHKAYLVFRATGAPGQPTANLFNLNWFELGGAGVGTP
jgi:hypothetical protein